MYKNIELLLNAIYQKNPIHKKKVEITISNRSEEFFLEFENFLEDYFNYLSKSGLDINYAVDAYLQLCKNMFAAQIYFLKTGKYPFENNFEMININVYQSFEVMHSYMIGLALSQFLWETHYEMYSFFNKWIKNFSDNIKQYLEIGAGHGLFLKKAIQYLKEKSYYKIIDISPVSIEITKSIIEFYYPNFLTNNIIYQCANILEIDTNQKYDFITAGEILEHLQEPERMLLVLKNLLTENGKIYLSSCVNCPAIDHLYKFNCISEIKEMIEESGFEVLDELILPVEKMDMAEIIKKKITINYCAILKRRI